MKQPLNQIRVLWQKDKEYYRSAEVGTGVQSFVKQILESECFNLKEGHLSTKLENRRNEFIYEKKAKESRRADFYIYINPEIAIPLEVECYGNIVAGEKQLLNYQKDFDKHYGILTDGFTWRFYNNNLFKSFTQDDLLNKTELFTTFWAEYIKPDFYYLSFFEKTGQLALIEETKLRVEDNRQLFFEDITKLIRSFNNKLKIEGYLETPDKKEKGKRAIELTYAYIIQFILYKTLVDNDFDNFTSEFEAIVKKIHQSLNSQRYKDVLGIIEGISTNISRNIYRPFTKEQEFIKDKIQDLYHSLENNLSDVSPWLDIFIFIKKYNFANTRNEIFGYIYENYLKELYEESKKGQYFTDPAVVNFMLEQADYTPDAISKKYENDKDSISIIDPSCGSGTFLYSATDAIIKGFRNGSEETSKKIEEVVTNSVFGLDIEEFPLYLAEMNILMRLLPLIINEKYNNPIDKKIKVFWTKDSIAEFINSGLKNTIHDIDVMGGQQRLFDSKKLDFEFESYMREKNDIEEMKQSMRPPRRRFDFVIGNPPYISYNECAKQKIPIFELMKQGKQRLNSIYGVNLHSTPKNRKKYSPKPNLYAFFIALGITLLKDNGKLCYIIPQTLLTAGDLDVLRYHLAKVTTIEKIIIFAGKMFVGRGLKQNYPIATSSLVFILSKKFPSSTHKIEIINHNDSDKNIEETFCEILQNKNVTRKKILQNKLIQNTTNWNFIRQSKSSLEFSEEYQQKTENMSIYYDHTQAQQKFISKFYFDIGFSLNTKNIIKERDDNSYELLDFKTFHNYSNFYPTQYYPKDRAKIKLTQNSQGYITLDQKYKIIWSIKNPDKFCFSTQQIIFYMGKASIICSNNQEEILYLFSLLNSSTNSVILKNNLKNENEKDFLIPIKAIKEFVRVPKITNTNSHLKSKVINLTEQFLELEKLSLADLVDFSQVMTQKFDKVSVGEGRLVLEKNGEIIKLSISKDSLLVKKVVETKHNKEGLGLNKQVIILSELMSLPIIDFDKQKEIKNHIDDLVFCLYFNIPISENKISDPRFIKSECQKNKFYCQLNP